MTPGDGFLLTSSSMRCYSRPGPLVAAIWALVLLDMLSSSRRNLDALSMVPPLAVITADPEFVLAIISSASSTKSVVTLFLLIPMVVTALFFIFGG